MWFDHRLLAEVRGKGKGETHKGRLFTFDGESYGEVWGVWEVWGVFLTI
jgi:hypothetical protein